MILDDAGIRDLLPFIISIVVISHRSGQPVAGACISAAGRKGKCIQDANGHYRVFSWQEPPVEITIAHHLYEPAVVTITDHYRPFIVNLRETCL